MGSATAPPGDDGGELDRVRAAYARRSTRRYGWDRPEVHVEHFQRGWRARRLLARAGVDLADARALDLGCGHGALLRTLVEWGCDPARLIGAEVIVERARLARRRCSSETALGLMDARRLPLPDGCLDLVTAFTVLSSILDPGDRRGLLSEVDRVLRPGGALLVYDLRYANPGNPDVAPVRARDLAGALPGYRHLHRTTTLMPPLARRLAALGALPVALAEALLPPLRSHGLHLMVKPGA